MACPACGGTELTVINVRVNQESDLKQLVGSTWDGRNMARCDGCGVLYDHKLGERDATGRDGEATGKVNCPECGSRIPASLDDCSHCGATLE